MNKVGRSEIETGIGIVIFIIIMGIFLFQGVFISILNAFNTPEFGGFGFFLGGLLILIIVVAFFQKLFGK